MPFIFPLARYTRFVRLSKSTLWVLAGLLTVAIIATAWINSENSGARIFLTGTTVKNEPSDMVKPRYQGLDSKNRPFNILANRATQPDADTVVLEHVNADLMLTDSASWVALAADNGVYHVPVKLLDLKGHVDLFYEGGYEFRTEEAQIDVNAGQASGETAVEGQGPGGVLRADRFKILDRGAIMLFNDNVHVTLYMKRS